jgi:O-methyltransferase
MIIAVGQLSKRFIYRTLLKGLKYLENRHNYYLIRGIDDEDKPANHFSNPILEKPESWFTDFDERWCYSFDAVRYGSLELLSREIHELNIEGAVAEVGVFRGVFASVINHFFPNKNIYLFDTFEGFDDRDVEADWQMGHLKAERQAFKETGVELVRSRMPYQDKVIIKKGWFPESANGCEAEKFCLVSLDTDLYQPIYSGLHWFYPRLANGGYIMVHDYNIEGYKGSKQAVREFVREIGASYVPLPDMGGTVVLGKPLASKSTGKSGATG